MIKTRPIYLMVSRTDTAVARMIRRVSRYPYNHVSVSLDGDFRQWYSFARYVQDAPFFSGLIRESAERFLAQTGDVQVKIHLVEIPEQTYEWLEDICSHAGDPDSGMIYNYFDALVSVLGLHYPVPGSYTCLSFACRILDRRDSSIESLCLGLSDNLIYEGSMVRLVEDTGDRSEPYFSNLGLVRGSLLSAWQLTRLTKRAMMQGMEGYMAYRFRQTVR